MWRVVYPVGIHFLISQIVAGTALYLFSQISDKAEEVYYTHTVFLTGLTGILAMIPACFFYKRDRIRRIAGGLIPLKEKKVLTLPEILLLLLGGAGLAQYGNILMTFLQNFINGSAYQESMDRITDGKSLFMLIFWMGIVAPIAEEMIFRWLIYLRLRDYMRMGAAAVISGLIFGIYHGNLVQAIYASLLGIAFAYILEQSGNLFSSALLHIGANTWSLLLSEYASEILKGRYGIAVLGGSYLVLLGAAAGIFMYFTNMGTIRKKRMI